ncbi:hypothetical protein LSH36_901g01010 [Paralvinella palmiformis]|uniref:Uncharacterized protein n=1 Tax=Paralvinella palmiformis TaxID=53620 RepID=A0AAD9IXQ6_9ANNE|nr:hypothetical protein LSH36_901g01010 [Paralvinella palmiformis]
MSSVKEKKPKRSKKKGKLHKNKIRNQALSTDIKTGSESGSDHPSPSYGKKGGQGSAGYCYVDAPEIPTDEGQGIKIGKAADDSELGEDWPVDSDSVGHWSYQLRDRASARCVLELQCVCEEGGGRDGSESGSGNNGPRITEKYSSRLVESTEYGRSGFRTRRQQYRESSAKSTSRQSESGSVHQQEAGTRNPTNSNNGTTTANTGSESSEQRNTATYRSGQGFAERSVRIEESREATTRSYELVDDRLVKCTSTRRRSSVIRDTITTTTTTATKAQNNRGSYSTKMATTKTNDKYIVSFNSDTSDSEEESGDDAKPVGGKLDQSNGKDVMTNGTEENPERAIGSESKPVSGSADPKEGTTKRESASKHCWNGAIPDLISGDDIPASGYLGNAPDTSRVRHCKTDTATDILIDISGTTPQVGVGGTRSNEAIINPELEGLSLSFSPKLLPEDDLTQCNLDHKAKSKHGSYDNTEKRTTTRTKALLNGVDVDDLDLVDVINDDVYAVKNRHKTDILDADILIYASPGSPSQTSARDSGYRKSKSFDNGEPEVNDRSFRSGPFERQFSNPEERPRTKSKYNDLDEKFSAICSKYGKDAPKREKNRPHASMADTPPSDLGPGQELYGVVRVKTGLAQNDDSTVNGTRAPEKQRGFHVDLDTDSGCNTPRQKITFDDMVNWDRSSTDELIKRILADAHNSVENNANGTRMPRDRTRAERSRDSYDTRRRTMPEPYEKEMGAGAGRSYSEEMAPSLLERRLASLAGGDKPDGSAPCTTVAAYNPYGTPDNDEPEQLYKRKSRAGSRMTELDDDAWSVDSASSSGRYVPWKQRQRALSCDRRDNTALAIPNRFDDSDSDNESYVSRRAMVPSLPDDCFKPQKSEDTDTVVMERTSEVRTMVDNQAEVLGRLKKASDSFDELEAEIRELKKEVMENNITRQSIIEDIIADIQENSATIGTDESPAYPQRYSTSSLQRSDNYAPGYVSPYSTRYGRRSRDTESCSRLDLDLESDRLGGYALGAVAKSKWGEPGGSRAFRSASVCRFDDVEDEKYDKYGLYNTISAKKWSTSGDNYDVKSDYGIEAGDDAETASIRSYPSEKSSGDRSDEAEVSSTPTYRSRYALAKYGTASGLEKSSRYGGSSYTSSTRPSRSSLYRSHTVNTADFSYDRPRIRSGSMPPPETSKPFTSRFLSKVREKRASGEYTKPSADKPFKSRFLGRSFDSDYYSASSSSRASLASTPDSSSPRSQRSRDNDVTAATASEGDATVETGK